MYLNQSPPPAPFDRLVFAASDSKPSTGWYRFKVPPGATSLSLRTPGQAQLFVNGKEVALTQSKDVRKAKLPYPDAPNRIAALRIQSIAGFEQGAAITAPITFEVGPGRIPLGSWDEVGLPHYAGGVRYTAMVTLPPSPSARLVLDLGRVRGSADVTVNGTRCGTRILHPYRFDMTDAAKAGENRIEIRVFNTLGPHFGVGHPSWHVFGNHTKSGIFGLITVNVLQVVDFELRKEP